MFDVLVVGAGIGGLCAARALSQTGASVRLIERDPRPSPAGAGILLAENALACLGGLGRRAAVEARGRWQGRMCITDASGRVLTQMAKAPPRTAGALLGLHRRALAEALLEDLDVPVQGGTTVARLEPHPDAVQVELSTGERLEARIVIGADGIGSQVRNLAFGGRGVERRYAGYTCWRVVVTAPGLEASSEMWGAGQRVGLIPLAGDEVYSFLVEDAAPGTPARETTSAEDLRARFAGFGGDAEAVLARIDASTDILHHDIEYLSGHVFQAGRIGLLGDAAHALTPNMGQGAAMAIEDAYVLAESVAARGPSPEALRVYEAARAPRVREVAQGSLRLGQVGQWRNPLARGLRDLLVRATPESVGRARVVSLVEGGPASGVG